VSQAAEWSIELLNDRIMHVNAFHQITASMSMRQLYCILTADHKMNAHDPADLFEYSILPRLILSQHFFPHCTAHDVNACVGSKRKADNRASPTTPITPTKTKSKARTSQSAASAYALSYQSNTFSVTYPPVQPFENTFTSYGPSYPGQTAFPINSTHTQLSDYTNCAASVPDDFHTHEYYCVEDETTFPATPSYAQYDDDHICYGLKLPEDPYILELNQGDFGDYQIQDSYKYQSLGKLSLHSNAHSDPICQ
jgi:hypothetical protein